MATTSRMALRVGVRAVRSLAFCSRSLAHASLHMASRMSLTARTTCRACESSELERFLDLGIQAPANALRLPTDTTPEFTAPLSVSWCPTCGLSQLDQVVDPKILYANYPFRAGVSESWRTHCQHLMTSLESSGRKFLIDIGSNDGTLLQEAVERHWKVLGVDPDPVGNLPSLKVFWSSGVARRIARMHGQADVVTATNVFGHVNDAKDFLEGIALVLKPRGVAIIECPHIFPLLENVAFDTIYHEHLSYWSLRPVEYVARKAGLKVVDVRLYSELHGGTMRYTLAAEDSRMPVKASVHELHALEGTHSREGIAPYHAFATKAWDAISRLGGLLYAERKTKRIWGYGASAKGNVLLQAAQITTDVMERVVDDCEAKWGLQSPGTGIPITSADDLSEPDVLVLLSWNNAEGLKTKAKARGFTGEFLNPHG